MRQAVMVALNLCRARYLHAGHPLFLSQFCTLIHHFRSVVQIKHFVFFLKPSCDFFTAVNIAHMSECVNSTRSLTNSPES